MATCNLPPRPPDCWQHAGCGKIPKRPEALIRCAEIGGNSAVWLEPVLLPEDLEPTKSGEIITAHASLTEADWRAKTTDDFQSFLAKLFATVTSLGLQHDVRWSAKSYIGLWRNDRCWCPIWPRKEACGRIYLPTPASWQEGDEDTAPPEFETFRAKFKEADIDAAWTWTYNAGSNPIAVTLRSSHLDLEVIKDFLKETWNAIGIS